MNFAVLVNQCPPGDFGWMGGQYKVHVQVCKGLFYRCRGHLSFEFFNGARDDVFCVASFAHGHRGCKLLVCDIGQI